VGEGGWGMRHVQCFASATHILRCQHAIDNRTKPRQRQMRFTNAPSRVVIASAAGDRLGEDALSTSTSSSCSGVRGGSSEVNNER